MKFLNFIIISISLFWTLGLTLPAHESKVVRRNFGPDHKGYQCGKKKYIMFDIDVAVKNACRAYSHQRKPKTFWSIFRDDSYPRLFPEAKKLRIPSKAQMWPLPPTGLKVNSNDFYLHTD
ncbi:CSEP0268 putative effector protein [Blumeria hordei DH14]|uniref:CSEP0268 putative effector protein n=1 Tax=Blumeria graminis f. sp. hordei (strain DH14) TaxID=546991 RepID=N1JJ88_BLUG1|nr:CSEP0268 putative effector protein [Blumeria hordei DH14]